MTAQSIAVEPNTTYELAYHYLVEYTSGDSNDGFTIKINTQESDGVSAGDFQTQPYIKNPLNVPVKFKEVTLDTYSINVPVGGYDQFNITDGNNGYKITQNNTNTTLYGDSTGKSFSVYGKTMGTTLVQVTDSV